MSNFRNLIEAQFTQSKKTIFFFWYYNTGFPEGTGQRKWSQYKPNLHVDLLNAFNAETGMYPSDMRLETTFIREEGGGVIKAKVKLLADASWIREVEDSNITDQKSPVVTQQHTNLKSDQVSHHAQFAKDHAQKVDFRAQKEKDVYDRRMRKRDRHPKFRPAEPAKMGKGFLPDFSRGTRDSFVSGMKLHNVKMTFSDRENKEIILWNDHDRVEGWEDFEVFLNFVSIRLAEVGFVMTRKSNIQRWFEKKPLEKAILRVFKSQNKIQLNFHTMGEPTFTKQDNKYVANQKQIKKGRMKRTFKENNFQQRLTEMFTSINIDGEYDE